MQHTYIYMFLLLTLSGCSSSKLKKNKLVQENYEARFHDVPFMFGSAKHLFDAFAQTDTGLHAEYLTSLTSQELIDFYTHEMELNGWQELFRQHTERESMLTFKKPHKWCTISLRNADARSYKTRVVLFVVYRQEHTKLN